MKRKNEGSDRIVFALVIVLGALIVGIIALEIIEALMGNDTELGPNTATLMATVSGALVGGVAGYVTQSAPEQPEVPQFSAAPVGVSNDALDDEAAGAEVDAPVEDVGGEIVHTDHPEDHDYQDHDAGEVIEWREERL